MKVSERSRGSSRRSVAVSVRLRLLSVWYDVDLVDLSASGYRYASRYSFAAGQRALLKLDTFEAMGGVVVWHQDGCGGVQFDRPLHPSVVDTIAARHKGLTKED